MESLRFPIGRFEKPEKVSSVEILSFIDTIKFFPSQVNKLVSNVIEEKLLQPYRPGGWNSREVIMHCGDSHLNSFLRFKLALTEDNPTIKPYFEDRWALLPDTQKTPIKIGLNLIESLHYRWVILLDNISEEEWNRKLTHPEFGNTFTLKQMVAMYDWHCRHHLEHIKLGIKK